MIYFTADTHWNHANIASKSSSKWATGYRGYKDLWDMNQDLVKNFNETLTENDTLYHLGDWSFGGIESIYNFYKQLRCKDIHLILGNHDEHIESSKYLPNAHSSYNALDANGKYIILDGPAGQNELNISGRDLFKSVSHYKEIKIGRDMFVLSHYAHRIWHGSHKGWLHLYGHSHDSLDLSRLNGKLVQYGKSMDCGIDSAIRILGKARPFAVNEITAILGKRNIEFPDHHDPKTNT